MADSSSPAEAERQIVGLIYRYNAVLDATDYDAWAQCFAADGIFRGAHADWLVHRDKEAFVAAAVNRRRSAAPNSRHFVTNILVEVDADTGTARSHCHLFVTTTAEGGKPTMSLTGEYEDFLVRENGKWLFGERRVHVDGRHRTWPPLGEVPEAGAQPYNHPSSEPSLS
jgi:3-phenylpropionate/cinnamic acid dioxygenase small subunit